MALQTGATLYLANKESLLPGQPLLQLLREKAITHVTNLCSNYCEKKLLLTSPFRQQY